MHTRSLAVHQLQVFEHDNPGVVPLVTPWILVNAIQAYELTIHDIAKMARASDFSVAEALASRCKLSPALVETYIALRAYEARMVRRFFIGAGALRCSSVRWPRFLRDMDFAEFARDDWLRVRSVPAAIGVQRAAAALCRSTAGVRVSFVTFNKSLYEHWLRKHGLSHAQFSMLVWAQHQVG